jgi:hypothetical protein
MGLEVGAALLLHHPACFQISCSLACRTGSCHRSCSCRHTCTATPHKARMVTSPDSLAPLRVSHGPTSPTTCHAVGTQFAHPQLALPQGSLEVHSCGLHLHWPGGHLQLSPQAGHTMFSPAMKEATPCHRAFTPQRKWSWVAEAVARVQPRAPRPARVCEELEFGRAALRRTRSGGDRGKPTMAERHFCNSGCS